ncbi:hypothetical protein E2C01_044192 [Portunus trituberculatus]|uniref:Uncharacterized protein n=1 Tax=Portunus trituberculatus TaxID=210409 RepID=A0A5B7G1L8_PORTR|nr:hypothetical protein [Portunus trituberculatus]
MSESDASQSMVSQQMLILETKLPSPRHFTQANRLLNTPVPLVDNKRTTHSLTIPRSQLKTITVSSTSSSSFDQQATKTPCNEPCNVA